MKEMKIPLGPEWEISTEHPACTCGQPLLVSLETNETYGPGDLVRTDQPGAMTADQVVLRLVIENIDTIPDLEANWALLDRFRRDV